MLLRIKLINENKFKNININESFKQNKFILINYDTWE